MYFLCWFDLMQILGEHRYILSLSYFCKEVASATLITCMKRQHVTLRQTESSDRDREFLWRKALEKFSHRNKLPLRVHWDSAALLRISNRSRPWKEWKWMSCPMCVRWGKIGDVFARHWCWKQISDWCLSPYGPPVWSSSGNCIWRWKSDSRWEQQFWSHGISPDSHVIICNM